MDKVDIRHLGIATQGDGLTAEIINARACAALRHNTHGDLTAQDIQRAVIVDRAADALCAGKLIGGVHHFAALDLAADDGQQSDHCQVNRTEDNDLVDDLLNEVSRRLAGTETRDKSTLTFQIVRDLNSAAGVLPYSGDTDLRANPSFRFSKGAVLGLLAKVYATWAGYPLYAEGKWELAADAAEQVVTSTKHALLTDFVQLWKNSAENIWDMKSA